MSGNKPQRKKTAVQQSASENLKIRPIFTVYINKTVSTIVLYFVSKVGALNADFSKEKKFEEL